MYTEQSSQAYTRWVAPPFPSENSSPYTGSSPFSITIVRNLSSFLSSPIRHPLSKANHPGTTRLFTDWYFPRPDGRAAILARNYIEPADKIDAEYPFNLITGRLSGHFNTRTRTGRAPKLNATAPDCYVEIHPEDGARLGIEEGDEVEVESRRGRVCLPARLTDRLLNGTIYIPWHYGPALGIGEGKLANLVTNSVYDIHSKQPEYKFSAVKVIVASKKRKT